MFWTGRDDIERVHRSFHPDLSVTQLLPDISLATMMDDYESHHMDYSYAYNDPEDDYQETQTQTQSTQQASQSQEPPPNPAHLWGYMQPVNNHLVRIDLYRNQHCWTVGRNTTENKIIFPGFKVSE